MCSSKTKQLQSRSAPTGAHDMSPAPISHLERRPVLQPKCSTATTSTTTTTTTLLDKRNSLKKSSATKVHLSSPPIYRTTTATTTINADETKPFVTTPPISPKLKSPRPPALIKKGSTYHDSKGSNNKASATLAMNKLSSKNSSGGGEISSMKYSSSLIVEAPGSIAAARREEVAMIQVQRKMRIAHYGRTKSAKYESKVVPVDTCAATPTTTAREEKRCFFITPNSDPIYVAYHDEEWGVPACDDNKLLFELLVLTSAQVGSDWTWVLKRRQDFRDAFSDFDAEIVSKYTEKKITSISDDYGIQLSLVRGVVDNSKRILEVEKEFGSLDKYLWGFVNHKTIATEYKSSQKIPVKTSKSESISKDMVRRGFRLVGPTVIHSFMQAAGLTNDHLITCPRHTQCSMNNITQLTRTFSLT